MNASTFLEEFFRARLSRMSVPSSLGFHLTRARDGLMGLGSSDPSAQEERHIRYAMMTKLWGSLSRLHQAVLFLESAPLGPAEYVKAWHAVFPDQLDELGKGPEGGDPIASCGPKVVLEAYEIRPRTHVEIGALLGLTPRQIGYALQQAKRKLDNHPLMRALHD